MWSPSLTILIQTKFYSILLLWFKSLLKVPFSATLLTLPIQSFRFNFRTDQLLSYYGSEEVGFAFVVSYNDISIKVCQDLNSRSHLPSVHSLQEIRFLRKQKFTKLWKPVHRFLADLGKLDGWFGQERGVYLGNKSYPLSLSLLLSIMLSILLFYLQQSLLCWEGGQLRSARGEILWEDESPHDFSYWNNDIREVLH